MYDRSGDCEKNCLRCWGEAAVRTTFVFASLCSMDELRLVYTTQGLLNHSPCVPRHVSSAVGC